MRRAQRSFAIAVILSIVCPVLLRAQAVGGRLVYGLECAWDELSAKEQKQARKLGYAQGGKVWKGTDSKGILKIRAGNLDTRGGSLDGDPVWVVATTAGQLDLVKPELAARPPLNLITHLFIRAEDAGGFSSPEIVFRLVRKWEDLTPSDADAARAYGYSEGDPVVFHFWGVDNFVIKPKARLKVLVP
jgi:hypothetical protein